MTRTEYNEILNKVVAKYAHLEVVMSSNHGERGLARAIIGFRSMKEVKEVAKEFGFDDYENVFLLAHKAGNDFYFRMYNGVESGVPYESMLSMDEFVTFEPYDHFKERVLSDTGIDAEFPEIKQALDARKKGEVVIINESSMTVVDTIAKVATHFSYDLTTYEIGICNILFDE
jgi:hypothetical protein